MHIQVNTDSNIEGHEALAASIKGVVESALRRFNGRITRVAVHLSDLSAGRSTGDDKRCVMEVRLEGRQPSVVSHEASTVSDAVDGAAEKLKRSVEGALKS